MEVVIDANILFSALIKNSLTSDLIFMGRLRLFSPDFMIEEFLKYESLILEKTKRTKPEVIKNLHLLKDIILIVPEEEYEKYIDSAREISPDAKDVLYLSLALKLKCPIWSNDKRLKNQEAIKVYSTSDLLECLLR